MPHAKILWSFQHATVDSLSMLVLPVMPLILTPILWHIILTGNGKATEQKKFQEERQNFSEGKI